MWPRPQTREVQAQPRVGEDFVLYDHLGDANNQCQYCKHDVRPQTFAVSQLQATGKADNRLSYRFQRSKPERCTSEVQIRGQIGLFGSSFPPGGAGERRGSESGEKIRIIEEKEIFTELVQASTYCVYWQQHPLRSDAAARSHRR
jgi:hypothetical protein